MTLGLEVRLSKPFDEAVEAVTEALSKEGFGVISRFDMDKAFKEKLDVDFRRYTILGACNPGLAHKAVSDQPEIGLLLPCNVTVEADGDASIVRLIDPEGMLSAGGVERTAVIEELMADAKTRLARAADSLR
jgi:uncharacterized protein (DUF302 family)